jgi:ribonuclease HI
MTHKKGFIVPSDGALAVFADGSSLPAPRRGGIGLHFVYCDALGNETAWDVRQMGVLGATNNQMELAAVIAAMKEIQSRRFDTELLSEITKVEIFTDSLYVVDNISNAVYNWPRTRWMTREGPPVQNVDQWKDLVRELVKLRRVVRTEIHWAKGHSIDNPHNKVADKLAKESAKTALVQPFSPVAVRRKRSRKRAEKGSVAMLGQRVTIRIVTSAYLREQKLHKYMFEVTSRRNPFYGNSDYAYSTNGSMRAGHEYRVTLGTDSRFPTIAKCHAEVVRPNDSDTATSGAPA